VAAILATASWSMMKAGALIEKLAMSDFDDQYTKRVREGCFKAILTASITDGELRLDEKRIYDGVISAIAMIHASRDEIPSVEITARMSDRLARTFQEKVAELTAVIEQSGGGMTKTKH
jgi:hypothetical protein